MKLIWSRDLAHHYLPVRSSYMLLFKALFDGTHMPQLPQQRGPITVTTGALWESLIHN